MQGYDEINDARCRCSPQNIINELCVEPSIDVAPSKTINSKVWVLVCLQFP